MKAAFPPIITSNTRILILGTVPSEKSLTRGEYYANPRNQFWHSSFWHSLLLPATNKGPFKVWIVFRECQLRSGFSPCLQIGHTSISGARIIR
jgi:hypothetical protein